MFKWLRSKSRQRRAEHPESCVREWAAEGVEEDEDRNTATSLVGRQGLEPCRSLRSRSG
jgi:hypothetical protein